MTSDIKLGDTIYKTFTSRALTGIPTVLSGSPVVVAYEDDGTTEITAGITLTVDFDGKVGLNLLTLVLTGANGYETLKDYNFVITTGTVDSVSVIGETVLTISIDSGAAAQDLANGTDGLGAIKGDTAAVLADTAAMQPLLDILSNAFVLMSAVIETVTSQTALVIPATDDAPDNDAYNGAIAILIDASDPNQKSVRLIDDYVASTRTVSLATAPNFTVTNSDRITILAGATAFSVADEVYSGSNHNISSSLARRLRGIQEFQGYEGGAVYIDSVNGSAGTVDFENGTVENAVAGLPDAFTIAASLKLTNMVVKPVSSVTFAASPTGFVIAAPQATLNGGSQDAAGTRINGGLIVGIWTHSTGQPLLFSICNMAPGGVTLSLESHVLLDCGLGGIIKLTSIDTIFWTGTFQTGATPTLDFNSVGGATVHIVDHKGPLTVINMSANDVLNAHFSDGGILTITGVDGTATISGSCQVTDSRTGSPVLNDNTLDTAHATLLTRTVNLVAHIAKFTGITVVAEWLGAIMGKQNADATALTEIKATGAASGSYDPNTDSIEAIRDTAPMGSTMVGTNSAATEAKQDTMQTALDTVTKVGPTLSEMTAEHDTLEAEHVVINTNVDATQTTLGTPADTDVSTDIANVKADSAAIKLKTDKLSSGIKKNVAREFSFFMADSSNGRTAKTGLSPVVTLSKDGGSFVTATNSPATEVASGDYKILFTQAEANFDRVELLATGSGADDTLVSIYFSDN